MTDEWIEVVVRQQYCPPGVCQILAIGSSAFIGLVDDDTVLKYPQEPGGDMTRLEAEHQILTIVGPHPGIIGVKHLSAQGLYLERATHGSIESYLTQSNRPDPSLIQRLIWCLELIQAIEHVHSRAVIHCDIQPTNVLLDSSLRVKLADFQGIHHSPDGEVILSGWSGEPCRYWCPREDDFDANVKTDLFAFASTVYFIMTGHEVFMDIVSGSEGWRKQVKTRFESGNLPADATICATVTEKCWKCQYQSASEVAMDLKAIEQALIKKA